MNLNPAPASRRRPFTQVDVFTDEPYRGNPLAVVVDAEAMTDVQMQQFANWTNLSETTFLLPPTHPEADYRVRIFTAQEEFPFAGHPTLGSAHAWLESGGVPRKDGVLVQECGAGLVRVRLDGGRLAFAAPPLTRFEPVDEADLVRIAAGLRLPRTALFDASWLVNGPDWIGVLLESAEQVLGLEVDFAALEGLKVGVIGPYSSGDIDFEVRTFIPGDAAAEDPVTGSFNAGAAQWLMGSGRAPSRYVAAQGTVLGRAGRVHVEAVDGDIWVGGGAVTCITGTVVA
ncbi:PhzF family phenazine biosynthesis protein [Pseudarthrobacter sp. J75]|uniref:PhzF family phenazine biosynthesis protein n=1 Tax=unclassified Pseudarthrobacter TaxID=2647000 RepID=UPI002E80AAEC|nr:MULTISPECIES: PhzF family phenazine biosynthesis protein [unclassified Pseudarthrobacter]MEE2524417.1 PhzF family phenazine biosynthesis protein [Pseudarthrobacter sp. J47]MEE2529848.1 PhzF family phenazine biosynthesis protein [Pseudarthrobacter sp. J75]